LTERISKSRRPHFNGSCEESLSLEDLTGGRRNTRGEMRGGGSSTSKEEETEEDDEEAEAEEGAAAMTVIAEKGDFWRACRWPLLPLLAETWWKNAAEEGDGGDGEICCIDPVP
jgi:hypothetical protein